MSKARNYLKYKGLHLFSAAFMLSSSAYAGETGCQAPGYFSRVFKSSAHKIYVKCVDDYYAHLEQKRTARSADLAEQIKKIKSDLENILDMKIIGNMVDCSIVKNKAGGSACFDKVKKMNLLIDEMDELNGWKQVFEVKKSVPSDSEKQSSCRFEGMKCPGPDVSLRVGMSNCFKEFYIEKCI